MPRQFLQAVVQPAQFLDDLSQFAVAGQFVFELRPLVGRQLAVKIGADSFVLKHGVHD